MFGRTIWFFRESENPKPSRIIHGSTLEVVWTVVPSIILLILAFPSFALLYSMDEVVHPAVTIKVTGNQWYWDYEYSDYEDESIIFDSYMVPEDELEEGELRLLEVDNRVVLPVDTHIRILVTGRDVIHCWSVPSLGVKCDGIPGRLNQTSVFIDREGTFYGQCSEICGTHHGFMPICVEGVSTSDYLDWVASKLELDTPEVSIDSTNAEDTSDSTEEIEVLGNLIGSTPEIVEMQLELAGVKSDISSIRGDIEIVRQDQSESLGILANTVSKQMDTAQANNKMLEEILVNMKK